MAKTAPVYARIDTKLKENAEGILAQLGISPSEAIKMLYSQIVLVRGMPFQSKLPEINHFSAQGITQAEFDAELQKGVDSIQNGRTHSVEDVDRMLAEEFGI
ncbi:type II toxin-antitoxin system RelB/DinJ family antitoxin [[Clostridium] aminophilum]|uniref:type II toxin-antitoxin system RelB/DinJ family antitoxin n=1 Tax=[Clostridium] aminophilum TaxID=1526 RepID=UPI003325EE9D